ncbi:MAG TPA: SDR family oxidoreductase [Lacipirellulaceae bacterium]|jgi:short-subunit dehydrogenase|nr:SDR family oxidoreductase [Lacipirellulaceae bacterium]
MRVIRNKKALISGAASGIGRSISLRLAQEGVHLFLVDIDQQGMAETAAEARRSGVEVITRRCDMAQPQDVSSTVAEVLSRWNGVDILVNNAGITYYGKVERMAADHWDRILRINLLSHVQFTRELLPSLLAREEAHVLNVCSVLGLVGMPKVTAYCTSKFGMVGFSESLRNELGRQGLGVTAVCPGFVRTNLFTNAPLEQDIESHKTPPRIVTTTPERVANAAVKAIYRNRRLVVMEPMARAMYFAKRFAPWLFDILFHTGRRKRTARKMADLSKAA